MPVPVVSIVRSAVAGLFDAIFAAIARRRLRKRQEEYERERSRRSNLGTGAQ